MLEGGTGLGFRDEFSGFVASCFFFFFSGLLCGFLFRIYELFCSGFMGCIFQGLGFRLPQGFKGALFRIYRVYFFRV